MVVVVVDRPRPAGIMFNSAFVWEVLKAYFDFNAKTKFAAFSSFSVSIRVPFRCLPMPDAIAFDTIPSP
jgi:hypothetical protein